MIMNNEKVIAIEYILLRNQISQKGASSQFYELWEFQRRVGLSEIQEIINAEVLMRLQSCKRLPVAKSIQKVFLSSMAARKHSKSFENGSPDQYACNKMRFLFFSFPIDYRRGCWGLGLG